LSVSSMLGEESQSPVSWFGADGEFLAGDVRVALDHTVHVGLLVNRGNEWERVTFVAPMRGQKPEPAVTRLNPGPQAAAVCVRLDDKGDLHTLFRRDDAVHYTPPHAGSEASSYPRPVVAGNSADLLISLDGRVVLVYYDFEMGPTFLRM
jgi:hypothetical protein